ncbi:TPA: hypothetical protein G9F27_005312 [Salmonella enterica]|uniref:Uncharacterized protein n=1 Tax=Salmonella enterica TaxID=28901 RepID=A0A743PHG8_SALER|nr:hypothetical protein [Salmonella enterica]
MWGKWLKRIPWGDLLLLVVTALLGWTWVPALTGLSAQLPEAARMARAASQITSLIDGGADTLKRIDLRHPANLPGTFDSVAGAVGDAVSVMTDNSVYLSKLASRMVTRSM